MRNNRFTEAINYLSDIIKSSEDENYFKEHKERYKEILFLFPDNKKNLRVLDIGSGFGHLTILIKKIFGYDVYALDHYSLWEDRFHREKINFILCELTEEKLPFKENWFDIVLFSEVLEHLFILPHKVLFEICRVLKPEGELILTTPNLLALYKRVKVLFGKSPFQPVSIRRDRGRAQDHIREYSMDELYLLLQETGFEVILGRYLQEGSIIKRSGGELDLNPLHIIYRIIAKAYGPFAGRIIMVAHKSK